MAEGTIKNVDSSMTHKENIYQKVILLISENSDKAEIERIEAYLDTNYKIKSNILIFPQFKVTEEDTLYLLWLSDQEIKVLLAQESSIKMKMGIVPNGTCEYAIYSFGIAKEMYDAIDDVMNASDAIPIDLLKCNGIPVLGNIVIGNVHGMNRTYQGFSNYLNRIRNFISDVMNLKFQSYSITTAKGNVTNTAATGIMVFEHNISGISHNMLKEDISIHDGQLRALILAPKSIISYLYYLFLSYFLNRLLIEKLPESIGVIASSKLEIKSPDSFEYMCDGEVYSNTDISLEILRDGANVFLGRRSSEKQSESIQEDEKETVRVQGLPKSAMSKMLVSAPVPFLPKADEEDFKDLFISLRQSGKFSSVFFVLMILSTLLATTGLFQNSTPVIIGAMVLAPLMSPIISFAMGVLRGEKELLKESTTTLFFGILTALTFSCLYTYLMPLNVLTDEMRSRLNPNILDLMVAVISGVAGAYAHAKSEVAKSLAGVAIAVALVPPLSVTGIGIGWWDTEVVYGSFLLFLTNLAGITLAAALTFLLLGFSPIHRATRGISYTSLFLVLVSVPLVISFSKVIEQNQMLEQLKAINEVVVDNENIKVRTLSIDLSKEVPIVYIETRSRHILDDVKLEMIKEEVNITLHRPVRVNILSEIEL